MAGGQVRSYAAELRIQLAAVGVDVAPLEELAAAASALADAIDAADGTLTQAQWNTVAARWNAARDAIATHLADALLGVLADVPGLAELVADMNKLATEGVHGSVDLGPVHLEVASATLVVQPPLLVGNIRPDPIAARNVRLNHIRLIPTSARETE